MNLSSEISQQFKEAYFGGNWTEVCLIEVLNDIDLKQATSKVHSLNTIAELVYHMNYYVAGVSKVLEKKPLLTTDKKSFDLPLLTSEEQWQQLIASTLDDGQKFADLIQKMPDKDLSKTMDKKEYGSFYKNFQGILEHFYYHLGQISLIKKILQEESL